MTAADTTLRPDWDMTPYFSELGGADYLSFRDALGTDMDRLTAELATAAPLSPATAADWADWLRRAEDIAARLGHLESYLGCATAADARDEQAQREESALATAAASYEKLLVAVRAALGAADDDAFATLLANDALGGAEYFLRRLRQRARHAMPAALEGLAADLAVDGIAAWGRLYDRVSGTLTFRLDVPGKAPQTLPVSMTRSLLEDADGDVRAATAAGAARAWESVAETVAACLNAISGTRLALYERRGIEDFLTPALFDAGIERTTLDAMWQAVRERQDLPQRFLRAKARLLGKERLAFHDLMAPFPRASGERLPWSEATERVHQSFAASYPDLAAFANRAIERRWIDYAPRPGKRPGGFCTGSHLIGESRIFMTYNGGMGDVQTLAHELGHAYHSWVMKDLRTWARRYPMTLAETASTFAEQLVTDAALAAPDLAAADRAAILDTRLQESAAFLLNIPTRFDFEYQVYSRRANGELSVSDLRQLMVDAQRANYGDSLADDGLDPWFWASKLHFYITDISFYNFPYTFGYLFSLGIVARARHLGSEFLPRYERLLLKTGSDTAEAVARDVLEVDLGKPDFWRSSIDLIAEDLQQFETLTADMT